MKILWADTETYSTNDIKRGAYVYAEASECILFTYAIDDGPVRAWEPHLQPHPPADLHAALSDPSVQLRFHNVDFDRTQMLRWNWGYDLNPMRFYCTMSAARMAGLPGGLEDLCAALGLPAEYSKRDGFALIRYFCIPDKQGNRAYPHADPAKWAEFVEYAISDVVSMRECSRRIPDVFSADERAFFAYTSVMNDRGVPIDRDLALKGASLATTLKAAYKIQGAAQGAEYTEALRESTDGVVQDLSITSTKAMLGFLAHYGVFLGDLRSSTVEAFLSSRGADAVDDVVRKVLETRVTANKASTSKYKAIMAGLNEDDRVRGTISFCGAGRTGRDAGRRIQPQNLARPMLVGPDSPINAVPTMEAAVEYIKDGSLVLLFKDPLQLLSDCVRGTIAAPTGKKFCQADLSNIEGRVCPWLMGEQWKLDYFAAFDSGQIPFDNYVMAYSKSFNVAPNTVTKPQRAIGKVQELASLYGGSVGAYMTFAAAFRIDMEKLGHSILENVGGTFIAEARGKLDWYQKHDMTYGLSDDVWTGVMAGVLSWRSSHSNIVKGWYKAEEAFVAATVNPGVWFDMAHNTRCINHKGWLLVKLPSGRHLVYPNPRVDSEGRRKELTFHGVSPFTKKFGVQRTGGPKLVENLTQAVARDCLFYNIPAAEAAGYPIILRVHDELLCETPDLPEFTGDKLADLIGQTPAWAPGLPMAAAGDTYYRYQK